jgi:hypothetical protein
MNGRATVWLQLAGFQELRSCARVEFVVFTDSDRPDGTGTDPPSEWGSRDAEDRHHLGRVEVGLAPTRTSSI